MAEPCVSIVMSVLNGAEHLCAALDSMLAQTLTDWELVVVDDGSTDATPQILAGYARRDVRVRVLTNEKNRGIAASHNRGLAACRAPYMAPMGADDVALPQWLHVKYQWMQAHPEVAALGNALINVDGAGRELGTGWHPPTDARKLRQGLFDWGASIPHGSALVRTDAARAVGGYRENFVASLDLDFWLRLGEHHALACLPDVLLHYRWHGGNISVTKATQQACNHVLAMLSSEKRRQQKPDPVQDARLSPELLCELLESGTQSALVWCHMLFMREVEHKDKYLPQAIKLGYARRCTPSFLQRQMPAWRYFVRHYAACTALIAAEAAHRPSELWQQNVLRVQRGVHLLESYGQSLPPDMDTAAVAAALAAREKDVVREVLYG